MCKYSLKLFHVVVMLRKMKGLCMRLLQGWVWEKDVPGSFSQIYIHRVYLSIAYLLISPIVCMHRYRVNDLHQKIAKNMFRL